MDKAIFFAVILFFCCETVCGQCGPGWDQHGDSCYHMSHETEIWTAAYDICKILGGYLAEANDATEAHFLENQAKMNHVAEGAFWLGANDLLVEGDWLWLNSNTKLASQPYSNWEPGEPGNGYDGENCMVILNNGLWNDWRCNTAVHYICEKDRGTPEVVG